MQNLEYPYRAERLLRPEDIRDVTAPLTDEGIVSPLADEGIVAPLVVDLEFTWTPSPIHFMPTHQEWDDALKLIERIGQEKESYRASYLAQLRRADELETELIDTKASWAVAAGELEETLAQALESRALWKSRATNLIRIANSMIARLQNKHEELLKFMASRGVIIL